MSHVTAREKASPPDPVIVSWSGLKRWEFCPQQQLRTIQHKTQKSSKGRIFLPGTVADLTMRRWLDDPTACDLIDQVAVVFDEVVNQAESKIYWNGDPKKDQEAVKAQVRTALTNLEPWLRKEVLPYDYAPEWRFKAHMTVPYICGGEGAKAPVTLIGGVDVLVRDDKGKFKIFDLKMTTSDQYVRSTLGQLTFYDIAVCLVNADFSVTDEWALIAPLHPEFKIASSVTDEDRQYMLSRIIKYAQGVWNDNWDPKPDDKGCNWCEARGACEKFKSVATVEENGKMLLSFAQAAAQRSKFRTDT